MYYCTDCKKQFDNPKVYYERHGLDSPPFERFEVCPVCSGRIEIVRPRYCHCCGARLPVGVYHYCSKACRKKGEKMWRRQMLRRRAWAGDPLVRTVDKVDRYNREHGTHYSYGQFVALILPKLSGGKV